MNRISKIFAISYFRLMRNSTKLKTLLIKYTVSLDIDDDGRWVLLLTDKSNNNMKEFEGESYSKVLSMAFRWMVKTMDNKSKQ